jgi:fatty-acid desaturase
MSIHTRRPDYFHYIFGGIIGVAGGILEYSWRDQNYWRPLYVGVLALAIGAWRFYIARYNDRNPLAPIRLWLSQLCLAVAVFIVGICNYLLGGVIYEFICGLGVLALLFGCHLYINNRSRIS